MSVPSIETKIEMAIRNRVASLPMATTYPIVWSSGPGTYTPSPTQPYLRCTWIPNQTERRFIGSNDPHRRPGVLQVDVMDTLARGSLVARETAGQVALHFATDLRMHFDGVSVRVIKAPSVGPAFIDTHVQVPTVIELETYA